METECFWRRVAWARLSDRSLPIIFGSHEHTYWSGWRCYWWSSEDNVAERNRGQIFHEESWIGQVCWPFCNKTFSHFECPALLSGSGECSTPGNCDSLCGQGKGLSSCTVGNDHKRICRRGLSATPGEAWLCLMAMGGAEGCHKDLVLRGIAAWTPVGRHRAVDEGRLTCNRPAGVSITV